MTTRPRRHHERKPGQASLPRRTSDPAPPGDDTTTERAGQDTPAVSGDPELVRRPGYYEHVDPALRAVPPVQKQFLLAGPDNRQKILAWLKRFANALDLKI